MSYRDIEDSWLRFAASLGTPEDPQALPMQLLATPSRPCGYRQVVDPNGDLDTFPLLAHHLAHDSAVDLGLIGEAASVDARLYGEPGMTASLWLDSPARALIRSAATLQQRLGDEPYWTEEKICDAAGLRSGSPKSFGDLFIAGPAHEVDYPRLCEDLRELCTWAARSADRAGLGAVDDAFPAALAAAGPAADLLCIALRFGQNLLRHRPVLERWQLAQWIVRCALASPFWGGTAARAAAHLRSLVPPSFTEPPREVEQVRVLGNPGYVEVPGYDLGTESCEGEPLHPFRIRTSGGIDPRDLCLLAVAEHAAARGRFRFDPGASGSKFLQELVRVALRPPNPVERAAQCTAALSPHCSLRMPADAAGAERVMSDAKLPWVDWIPEPHREVVLAGLLEAAERESDRDQLIDMLRAEPVNTRPMTTWLPGALARAQTELPKTIRARLARMWERDPATWQVALPAFAQAIPSGKLFDGMGRCAALGEEDRELFYRAAQTGPCLLLRELTRENLYLRFP